MAAQNLIDLFLGEQNAGNTNFARFIETDQQVKLVIAHVIDDFKKFAESGLDISQKNSHEVDMKTTQRVSYLFENGFNDEHLDQIKELLKHEICEEHRDLAADTLLPAIAVQFIATVIEETTQKVVGDMPAYFRK